MSEIMFQDVTDSDINHDETHPVTITVFLRNEMMSVLKPSN
jgi:hypothetical protein